MKILYILTYVMTLGIPITTATADCTWNACTINSKTTNLGQNCGTTQNLGCISGILYTECATCKSNYSKTTSTYTDIDSGCPISYTTCTSNSTGGTPCAIPCLGLPIYNATDTAGYERESRNTCNETTGQCEYQPTNSYRCAAGYHGTAVPRLSLTGPTTLTGCTECPKHAAYMGIIISTTSQVNNNANASDCYVPAKTPIKDPLGTYEFTENCYYTE